VTALQKADSIRAHKGGRPVTALTAYDYPTARLLDEGGIDILLVGDSLGMVVLGFPDTTHVTLDHMLHHVAAVARATPKALIVGDLPIHTYETPTQALETARRLVAAGAEAVKLEGGIRQAEKVRAITEAGIDGRMIGVDKDIAKTSPQYADMVLTSVEKRMTNAVYDIIKASAVTLLTIIPTISVIWQGQW
jgi:3-methyl-2-oxobutanoate hydroxymethyltransferase